MTEWTEPELRTLKTLIDAGVSPRKAADSFPGKTWRACYETAKRKGYVSKWRGGSVVRPSSGDPHPIIKKLDAMRVEMGLTQMEFSQMAGFNPVQWNLIVRERVSPSIDCVSKFAQAIGMELDVNCQ